MVVQNWHLIIKPLDNKVQKYFRISKNARTKRNDDGKKLKIIEYIDPNKAIKKGFSGHHVR